MLWCAIKYMPYLVQRWWWWLTVIFHHYLCIATQVTPYHCTETPVTNISLWLYVTEDSTNGRGHTSYRGAVLSSGLQDCRRGCWSGLQLSLGPWANPSHCKKKPLPAPMALMHMLWQLFLCWVLQASHPQTPYPCELSPGLQGSSKQVSQVQDDAHQAALGDLKSASLFFPAHGKRGPWNTQGHSSLSLPSPVQQCPSASSLRWLWGPWWGCTTAPFAFQNRLNHGDREHRRLRASPAAWQVDIRLSAGFHSRADWLFLDQHEALLSVSETRLSTTHTSAPQRPRATGKGNSTTACFHFSSNCPTGCFHSPRWAKETSNLVFFSASSRNKLSWNIFSQFISHSCNEFAPFDCFANMENTFFLIIPQMSVRLETG